MVSEVESAHSKKWEVGNAELKPTGLGFIRASSALGPQSALKPACGDGGKAPIPRPTPVATPPKKKAASTEGGRKLHCSLYVPDIICKSGGNTLKFYL